jgi:DNA primase
MTSAVGLQLLIDLDPHSGKTFDIIREAAAVTIALSDQFCIVKCPKTIGTGVLGPTFYDSNGEP